MSSVGTRSSRPWGLRARGHRERGRVHVMYVNDLAKVIPGTVLGETIYGGNGQPLLYEGVALTSEYLSDLRKLGIASLYVRDRDTADIQIPHPVSPEARG